MKFQKILIGFIQKEWLLIISVVCFFSTSAYINQFPTYSIRELQVLFILFSLFVAVKGLQQSGLMTRTTQVLENGHAIPLKLVASVFFLSMLVTNDIALMVIVPLTLALNIPRKDFLVILESLSANAGSALTPFGNPQNLFIYWFYDLHPMEFLTSIAPFSLFFFIILIILSSTIKTKKQIQKPLHLEKISSSSYIYGCFLLAVLFSVLHVLPVLSGLLVIVYALFFDRKNLYVDYPLLLSFFFFFGLAENMKIILLPEMEHTSHVFLISALSSQVMSNVPAALVFAKFTTNWEALLWGTNVGGFGCLYGSFANLIAYRLYITHENTRHPAAFTIKFLALGYLAFFCAIGLFFLNENLNDFL